jgi:hypothetical protein
MTSMWRAPTDPNTVIHAATACPHCGTRINAAAQPGQRFSADPGDGCLAICFRCIGVGVYVIDALGRVEIRKATEAEAAQAETDHAETFADLRAFHAKGGGRWLR